MSRRCKCNTNAIWRGLHRPKTGINIDAAENNIPSFDTAKHAEAVSSTAALRSHNQRFCDGAVIIYDKLLKAE
jgi:hypothetical protein